MGSYVEQLARGLEVVAKGIAALDEPATSVKSPRQVQLRAEEAQELLKQAAAKLTEAMAFKR